MAPTVGVSVKHALARPWLWFIAPGATAVLIGLIAVYLVDAPLWVIYAVLPTSMLTFDPSPADLTNEILVWLLAFGGSFLLYGTAGWLVGNAIRDFWTSDR